jgi:uncharacterized protein (TIGR02466 family)
MTNNNVLKFFPDPVFKYKISDYKKHNKDLTNYIYDIYNKDQEGIHLSNINGWHSRPFNLQEKNSPPHNFFLDIKNHIIDVFENYGWVFNSEKIKCQAMWAVINKKDNFNVEHIHANCHLSAAYYVKLPKNSGNLKIYNPNNISRNRFPQISKPTELNILSRLLKVSEGDLLIFPSYLPHSVPKNESDEDRIVVSFNLEIQ